jgi:hypothetical protein
LIQKVFVFESGGRSGKSACLGAWGAALGPYAGILLGSVLGSRATDNAKSSAMAGIDGCRLLRLDEVGSVVIDIEMLKTLSGEEKLSARAMAKDWTEIRNCATLIATSNAMLNLSRDVSEALRSRIVYLQFPHRYVDVDLIGKADYADDGSVRVDDGGMTDRLKMSDMHTAVLTWMYAGLSRMIARAAGGDGDVDSLEVAVRVKVTEASRETGETAWAENNLVKMFFEECGLFRPVGIVDETGEIEAGIVVATNGLRQKMIEWARVMDPEFCEELERGPRVLAKMLQKQRVLGYEPVNNASGALWQGDVRQCRAWRVPYIFTGVGQ